ncbi:MAG: hypothetical protein E7348_04940 [Clostridiales bacterium]|nr:hypothetical protein [Clostridiales bacterium]
MKNLYSHKKLINAILVVILILSFSTSLVLFNNAYADTDYDKLYKNNNFSCQALYASDLDSAKEYAQNYIENEIGINTSYTVTDKVYIEPQVGIAGQYIFDVQVDGQETVTMTMTILGHAKPAVLDFSNPSTMSLVRTSNAKLTSANNRLKMTSINSELDDGFYLSYTTPSMTDETFVGENLRYMVIKYKTDHSNLRLNWGPKTENPDFQLYYWKSETSESATADNPMGRKDFTIKSGGETGHELTLIIDMAVGDNKTNAIYCYDQTTSTISNYKFTAVAGSNPNFEGEIGRFRLNFARNKGDRTTFVDYIGFFSTFEQAKNFTPVKSSSSDAVKELSEVSIHSLWGDARTQEKAEQAAVNLIGSKYGVSCSIINAKFVPSTTETQGSLTFDGVFKIDSKTQIIKDIVMTINEKPSDYQMLDMSEPGLVDKFTYANIDYSMQGDYLKIVSNDIQADDGFYFHVGFGENSSYFGPWTVGCENAHDPFYLQDYSFVVFRYKRIGIGGGQFYFATEGWTADLPYFSLYFGRYEEHWYTSILCTDVKSYEAPIMINYDETLGVVESVNDLPIYGITKADFSGLITNMRFTWARRAYLEREALIDYIGFFPTQEDAQAYFAKTLMDRYSGEDISFAEGQTQEKAVETLEGILTDRVGAGLLSVNLLTTEYVAPVRGTSNGKLVATIQVIDQNGNVMYEYPNVTFNIYKDVDQSKSEFVFTNPYFVTELKGSAPRATGNKAVLLAERGGVDFTWNVNEDETFYISDKPYVAVKLDANASDVNFLVNGNKVAYNGSVSGEQIIVMDISDGGKYYGKAKSVGMTLSCDQAKIYSMAFFSTLEQAQAYTGEQDFTAINQEISKLSSATYTSEYENAFSEISAVKTMSNLINGKLSDGYTLYDIKVVDFTSSTLTSAGSLTVTAIIQTGSVYRSIIKEVELTLNIKVADELMSNGQRVTDGNVYLVDTTSRYGHDFYAGIDGNLEYVYAKNSISTPKSIEFWVNMPSELAIGRYNVMNDPNRTFEIYVQDGNIYVINNQTIFNTTGLNIADGTFKHVAIVFDTSAKVYVNGNLVGTFACGQILSSLNGLYIGRGVQNGNAYDYSFAGQLSDIRIWSTILTEQKVNANMVAEFDGSEQGLEAYWKLQKQVLLDNIVKNERGYYADSMGYEDFTSNANDGVFYSNGWYNLENIRTDYTIIQVADTQSYTVVIDPDDPNRRVNTLEQMYKWIGDNKEDLNIVLMNHLGDVTQNATPLEWKISGEYIEKYIEANGIPYNIAVGNHDVDSPYYGVGAVFRDTRNFDAEFDLQDRIMAQFENIGWARFGGSYDGDSSRNVYMFLEGGTGENVEPYIVFVMEFGPTKEVVQWVQDKLVEYSNYNAIILTHCYFDTHGNLTTWNAQNTGGDFAEAYEGIQIWNEVASKYDNVVMVNCGHSQNQQVQIRVNENEFGNGVVQILSDPSAMITGFPSGKGIIELMCFTYDGKMHTYYYSPDKGMFYDTQFEATMDMHSVTR